MYKTHFDPSPPSVRAREESSDDEDDEGVSRPPFDLAQLLPRQSAETSSTRSVVAPKRIFIRMPAKIADTSDEDHQPPSTDTVPAEPAPQEEEEAERPPLEELVEYDPVIAPLEDAIAAADFQLALDELMTVDEEAAHDLEDDSIRWDTCKELTGALAFYDRFASNHKICEYRRARARELILEAEWNYLLDADEHTTNRAQLTSAERNRVHGNKLRDAMVEIIMSVGRVKVPARLLTAQAKKYPEEIKAVLAAEILLEKRLSPDRRTCVFVKWGEDAEYADVERLFAEQWRPRVGRLPKESLIQFSCSPFEFEFFVGKSIMYQCMPAQWKQLLEWSGENKIESGVVRLDKFESFVRMVNRRNVCDKFNMLFRNMLDICNVTKQLIDLKVREALDTMMSPEEKAKVM